MLVQRLPRASGLRTRSRPEGRLATVLWVGALLLGFLPLGGCSTIPQARELRSDDSAAELHLPLEAARVAQVLAHLAQDHWPSADGDADAAGAPIEHDGLARFRVHYAIDPSGLVRVGQGARIEAPDLWWSEAPELMERTRTRACGRTLVDLRIERVGRRSCQVVSVDRSQDTAFGRDLDATFRLLQVLADLRDRVERDAWSEALAVARRFHGARIRRTRIQEVDSSPSLPNGSSTVATELIRQLHDSTLAWTAEAALEAQDRLTTRRILDDLIWRHRRDDRLLVLERRSTAILSSDGDWTNRLHQRAWSAASALDRWAAQFAPPPRRPDPIDLGRLGDRRAERILLRRDLAQDRSGARTAAIERSLDDHRAALTFGLAELAEGRERDGSIDADLLDRTCADAVAAGDALLAARLLARHWPEVEPVFVAPMDTLSEVPRTAPRSPIGYARLVDRLEQLRTTLGQQQLRRIAASERCEAWIPFLPSGLGRPAFQHSVLRRLHGPDRLEEPAVDPRGFASPK